MTETKSPRFDFVPVSCKQGLNSLWGEFCQNDDKLVTEFVNDPLQFYRWLNGTDVEMHDFSILNDDLVEIIFKRTHEYKRESKVTNIFIGIFYYSLGEVETLRNDGFTGGKCFICRHR